MSNYDLLGNIALVKFSRGESLKNKKKWAEKLLRERKAVTTVLEKTSGFSKRLRTQKTKFIAGVNTKEALYKENGCVFRFNVDTCYFSPRLSSERLELAKKVKRRESVLVMFGGVAPFAVVIGKLSRASKVVSVELGRECNKYAKENVKRNKLGNVEIVQGDVKKKVFGKYDRIVMARPNLKSSFLDVAFRAVKKGGVIYYYGFYSSDGKSRHPSLRELIIDEAKKAKRRIKILRIKKAGEIGVKKFRYRIDFRVS